MTGRRAPVVRTGDGVTLATTVRPSRGPARATVVVAHGWALGSTTFDELAAAIPPDVAVVRYDQRGHGRSGAVTGDGLTVRRLGLDYGEVVDALAPSGALVLVGHSMGGMALLALLAQRPRLLERTAGVLLMSTSCGEVGEAGLRYPPPLRPLVAAAFTGVMTVLYPRTAGRGRGVLVRLCDRLTVRSCFGQGAPREHVTATRELIAATSAAAVRAGWKAISGHDERAALEHLRSVPTRVLVGDRDVLTPPSHAVRLAREARARLVVVPRVGHMPHLEAPDVVLEQVCALLPAPSGRARAAGLPRGRREAVTA